MPISKAGWKLVGLDGRDRTADNKQGLSARGGLPADAKSVNSQADEVATAHCRTLKVGKDAAVGKAPVEPPAGPLTAIGLFAGQTSAARAFDTFEVTAR